jgi:hypothetical protein
MNLSSVPRRGSTIRKIGWLGVASMLALALLAPAAAPAFAAKPPPKTEITICHEAPPGSGLYNKPQTVSTDSTGGPVGHAGHSGDIIPANGDFPGQGDPAIIANDCVAVAPTGSPPPPPSPTASPSGSAPAPTASPATPTASPAAPTTNPSQNLGGETQVTLPSTDTISGPSKPSSDGWRMLLIAAGALLASVLVLTPGSPVAARRR